MDENYLNLIEVLTDFKKGNIEMSDCLSAVQQYSNSQHDGKPPVKRSVWVVYPDSVRMGLSDENKPAAWFLYSDHAYNWAKSMWEKFYIVERTEIHCV